ncbi:hypothetical protein Salat_0861600 [Sesamum alatum]|uniref:S-protein homolog n=1 Tax=Sesamum alatum TaxID=300844 RepID=A0AAE1YJK1_9LAMI|nr:hypothetical protein Salat_0861600 [Sesamum alatum]
MDCIAVIMLMVFHFVWANHLDATALEKPLCILVHKYEVHIINSLPQNFAPLVVHCTSGDDDLGSHTLTSNQVFQWSYCENVAKIDRYPITDLDSLLLVGTLHQTRWYGGPPSIVVFPPGPEPFTLGPNPSTSSIEPPNPFNHTTPSIASLDSGQKNILIYSPTPYGISLSAQPTKG